MRPSSRIARLLLSVSLLALAGFGVAGCQTGGADLNSSSGALSGGLFSRTSAAADASAPAGSDWRKETGTAGDRYKSNPKDAAAAMRYAEALRHTGQRAQAAAVLQTASINNPNDMRVLGAYGRALADAGQLDEALSTLSRAHSPDQPDWRILSAQGAVLDQMGRSEEARRYYASALKMAPDEPSVLSNLGLSYALTKDLRKAEETLRKAAERGKDEQRVRQNLALVVGLQGRFQEAEDIARADLPAEEAAANVTYLRQMLAEHDNAPARTRTAKRAG
jgi:Flp pilus assembly protein TadD